MRKVLAMVLMMGLLTGCGKVSSQETTTNGEAVVNAEVTEKQTSESDEKKETQQPEVTGESDTTKLQNQTPAPVLTTQQPSKEVGSETTSSPTANPEKNVVSSKAKVPEGMHLYKKISLDYMGKTWKVQLYASAEVDGDGELMLDDRCRFIVRVASAKEKYILFDEQMQSGVPSVDVFVDETDILHVVVTNRQTASYVVTDNRYQRKKKGFVTREICGYEGVNYWGGL